MSAPTSVTPGPDGARALRSVLSRFGTGVTVVTTDSPDGPVGITANSFSSVSLDPALVLWSLSRGSRRYPWFAAATHWAIHVLGSDQDQLCRAFATSPQAFDGADWSRNAEGVPVIDGCLARFECRRFAEHAGGDHAILVAEVLRASARDGDPLLFFGGAFGSFAA